MRRVAVVLSVLVSACGGAFTSADIPDVDGGPDASNDVASPVLDGGAESSSQSDTGMPGKDASTEAGDPPETGTDSGMGTESGVVDSGTVDSSTPDSGTDSGVTVDSGIDSGTVADSGTHDSGTDAATCSEGTFCTAGDGGAGICHAGACCQGCWDGTTCQVGTTDAVCAINGPGGACGDCSMLDSLCASYSCGMGGGGLACKETPRASGTSCGTNSECDGRGHCDVCDGSCVVEAGPPPCGAQGEPCCTTGLPCNTGGICLGGANVCCFAGDCE